VFALQGLNRGAVQHHRRLTFQWSHNDYIQSPYSRDPWTNMKSSAATPKPTKCSTGRFTRLFSIVTRDLSASKYGRQPATRFTVSTLPCLSSLPTRGLPGSPRAMRSWSIGPPLTSRLTRSTSAQATTRVGSSAASSGLPSPPDQKERLRAVVLRAFNDSKRAPSYYLRLAASLQSPDFLTLISSRLESPYPELRRRARQLLDYVEDFNRSSRNARS